MGLAAIASMLLSVRFGVGVIFDLRLAIIESAADSVDLELLITAIMAAGFRFYGGAGVAPGLTAIAIVFVLGSSALVLRRPQAAEPCAVDPECRCACRLSFDCGPCVASSGGPEGGSTSPVCQSSS